jgi:RHS repeat-associated protein
VDERLFVYDGNNLVAELLPNHSITRKYVWGLDLSGTMSGAAGVGGLLAVSDGTSTHYPTYDANGNITAYLDASDNVVYTAEYSPFGKITTSTGTAPCQFGFSTIYRDADTGLLAYRFRDYDPNLGRWPARDPLGEDGGVNLYAMVGNDPVGRWDNLGLVDGNFVIAKPMKNGASHVSFTTSNDDCAVSFYIDGNLIGRWVSERMYMGGPSKKKTLSFNFSNLQDSGTITAKVVKAKKGGGFENTLTYTINYHSNYKDWSSSSKIGSWQPTSEGSSISGGDITASASYRKYFASGDSKIDYSGLKGAAVWEGNIMINAVLSVNANARFGLYGFNSPFNAGHGLSGDRDYHEPPPTIGRPKYPNSLFIPDVANPGRLSISATYNVGGMWFHTSKKSYLKGGFSLGIISNSGQEPGISYPFIKSSWELELPGSPGR